MLGRFRVWFIVAALGAAVAVAGCGGQDTQRAGGAPTGKTTVLKLANANDDTRELQAFIDQVNQLSGGRLRIEPVNRWRKGQKRSETGLVEDVRAGKADLGWVGSRALSNVGVKSFDPLNAPFLIDSYELEDQVVGGTIAKTMLAGLKPAGVTGIAVLPGPLKFLQLDRKIDGPAGLRGLKIAVSDSPLEQAALSALGADPVVIAGGASMKGLNGVENHASAILGNHSLDTAKYTVADLPLWPRPLVVFAATPAWNALSAADRTLVGQAASRARSEMLAAVRHDEGAALDGMCKAGDRIVDLGEAGRARMQAAVAPLLTKLRDDPATHDSVARIESLRTGASPHSIACPAGSPTRTAALAGTFETTIRKSEPHSDTVTDWQDSGATSIKLKLELADGRAVIREDYPQGTITGFDEGYTLFKDIVRLAPSGGPGFTARWQLHGNRLRFSDISGGPDDKFIWGHNWIKTG